MGDTISDKSALAVCLAAIESKLDWGDTASWKNFDFEKLSEIIRAQTGVVLSVTTLKRIWGRVKYTNKPTATTLNTLAQFIGHRSWRTFVQEQEQAVQPISENLEAEPKTFRTLSVWKTDPRKLRGQVFKLIAATVAISFFSFFIFHKIPKKQSPPNSEDFRFSVNKIVTNGVPNSVIFSYDAAAAKSDSVLIAQTWDLRRTTAVPKNKNTFSSIYYYPGFFRTKLIVGSQIVKQHDLMITTDGWLALVEQSPVPMYFDNAEIKKDSSIGIDSGNLKAHNISFDTMNPKLRFFNMRDMGDLQNDNFRFETSIKTTPKNSGAGCQSVQILIQCKDDIIIIPFSAKNCSGKASLYFAGTLITNNESDLSKFSFDPGKWTSLRIESRDKNVRLWVNDKEACSLTFDHVPTGIVGLQYRFEGTGSIGKTWIANEKKTYTF